MRDLYIRLARFYGPVPRAVADVIVTMKDTPNVRMIQTEESDQNEENFDE